MTPTVEWQLGLIDELKVSDAVYYALCQHCEKPPFHHVNDRCLYASSTYTAAPATYAIDRVDMNGEVFISLSIHRLPSGFTDYKKPRVDIYWDRLWKEVEDGRNRTLANSNAVQTKRLSKS